VINADFLDLPLTNRQLFMHNLYKLIGNSYGLSVVGSSCGEVHVMRATIDRQPTSSPKLTIFGLCMEDSKEAMQAVFIAVCNLDDVECRALADKNVVIQNGDLSSQKQGDSYGLAAAAAFIGLAKGKVLSQKYAFTGAVDVNGFVDEVGGVEAKIGAANRFNLGIVMPERNKNVMRSFQSTYPKIYVRHISELLGLE
jgi:ATP-dependent Lon protease